MQQTRVDQGLPYYMRFLAAFPNVGLLHLASDDEIMKLWQGLGYYSRARNMKKAAKQIVDNFGGIFPQNYEQIRALSGIGSYTAAAIASMAFGLPYAVVDGNVYRVLSRCFDIDLAINSAEGVKVFAKLAQQLLPEHEPGTYNQAIMEFGALYCKPQNPNCLQCILSSSCLALKNKNVSKHPVKNKGAAVQKRYLNYFFLSDGNRFLIEKRQSNDIWKGLFQLPLLETSDLEPIEQIINHVFFKEIVRNSEFTVNSITEIRHKLTHRLLEIRFLNVQVNDLPTNNYRAIVVEEAAQLAFPKPIFHYINQIYPNE